MRRRDFLKLLATSTTGAVLFTGCKIGGYPDREFQIQSPVEMPADLPFARDNWYATAFPRVGGGIGAIVRIFEGRAKKVEGNPDFPLNMGRTGPRAQAIVQEVYHPDRVRGSMRRTGARGAGEFEFLDWDDAFTEVARLVGEANSPVLVTEPLSGAMARVVAEFAEGTDTRHVVYEPDEYVVLREAMQRVFGTQRLPTLDLANANTIVSFGADFLHTWISPVQFSMGYGEFRQGRPDVRGTYYHVSPRLSDSAASADRWFPILPGSEGIVALSVASALAENGTAQADAGDVFPGVNLDDYSPDNPDISGATGLSGQQIRDIAEQLGNAPSIAIAGGSAAAHTNGLFNVSAVFALNYLTGSVNTEGGIVLNPDSPVEDEIPGFTTGAPFGEWQALADEMRDGAIDLLMVHGANPVYGLPAATGFADALDNVGMMVSFSSFIDETTAHADLILPDHTTLESWGLHIPDPGPGFELISVQQPVVQPFVSSFAFGDTLIRVAGENGVNMPWGTVEQAVRSLAEAIQGLGRGMVETNDDDDPRGFMIELQTQGGWWDPDAVADEAPGGPEDMPEPADPQFTGDIGEYPFYLLPFPSNSHDYGESANLPWLQGLPDPITTGVWTTWVELNPDTAEDLGVQLGDIVRVESPVGSIEVPVYVNPAAPPNVAAIPMGQGHRHYGRYAQERGANPIEIVAAQTEAETGALAWAATRVRIEPLDRRERFPRFERQLPFQLEENPIVRVTRG
jgi:menaquinone reductase, molybdopterin-binding-like subunit